MKLGNIAINPCAALENISCLLHTHIFFLGFYQMCFANYNNHFGEMRVFLNFGVFYEEEAEPKKENEMDEEALNSTLSNIKVPYLILMYSFITYQAV